MGNIDKPSVCNESDFAKNYANSIAKYIENKSFSELAGRYAANIANGRFLWRNRVGAEKIEVIVKDITSSDKETQTEYKFDSKTISIRDFENNNNEELKKLTSKIAQALSSKDSFLLLDITAFAKVGEGQDVYPSEELVLDKSKSKKEGKKSKILYAVDEIAAMHSQKIGNAIRTIDTWYPDFNTDEGVGAIAIEPYGAVTTLGKAFRSPANKKSSFFNLFEKFVQDSDSMDENQEHYVVAVLVRGGVFGESSKE